MNASVLVVEDNQALAENLVELFEEIGATASTFGSAPAALAHAREHDFDLAIVDLRLPGNVDGLSLVPPLKECSPLGEIILVTGNASLDTAITAVRHGVFAYVLKPFDPADLLALGERALAQVSLRREREALARELATSEALYRGVVDSVEALIMGVDRNGRITFCNRYAYNLIGLVSDECSGLPFVDLFLDEHRKDMEFQLERALGGEVIRDRQVVMPTASHGERIVRWTLMPLETGSGTQLTLLVRGIDVTERIELERRSAENAVMATMGRLTTGLAHEIRNPLNAATLQLELLERTARKVQERTVADKIGERAAIVREEIASLSRMLEEFLSLARPRELSPKPTDLVELMCEVVELHGPVAANEGVSVQSEMPSGLGTVMIDRDKIKQVLVNLIGNAVDAMRDQDGGEVHIEAAVLDDDWVEVSVRDTGPGVADEVLDQAFHPFVTTKPAGTGLGLSIVHRTVEQHGGSVSLGPAPDGGAIVRFTLPRSKERLPTM